MLPHLGNFGQQLRPFGGVGLHQVIFLWRELSLLVQNGIGDRDLAHVVGDGCHADQVNLLLAQALPQGCGPQQVTGDIVNPADVLPGLVASELNGSGQSLHHTHAHGSQLFGLLQQLFPLPFHFRTQPLSGPEQFHHRVHPTLYHIRHHRLANHVHDAQGVGLLNGGIILGRCNQEKGHLLGEALPVHPAKHFNAIHFRHHHVQQHCAQAVTQVLDSLQSLFAVLRLYNLVIRLKDVGQNGPVDLFIVYNQYSFFSGLSHDSRLLLRSGSGNWGKRIPSASAWSGSAPKYPEALPHGHSFLPWWFWQCPRRTHWPSPR